ncbi:hypothetical protein OG874_21765 [Nocardia sp. NBC_00565]|uniref:hypothetical protein n=1 Tax=Nocardia sp. NBC_00565 TaxID=2975993 RepID=UPI002E8062F4|nr:hypothetical protein [Nocardia sp. NBC_00565]WUC07548.1 hypothetical protein OG874_21765 [Nocardia sp. NBC_00565]
MQSLSERFARKVVGLARATYRRIPIVAAPADPEADLRAWLRAYATKRPARGSGVRGPRCATTQACR